MFDVFVFEDDLKFSERLREGLLELCLSLNDFDMRSLDIVNSDFEKFVSKMPQKSSKHNIYIFDIDLNDSINGLQLGQKIREFDFDGYFIYLTSHAAMLSSVFNYRVRCIDFIDKGNECWLERLKDTVLQICNETHTCDKLEGVSDSYLIYDYHHDSYKINCSDIVFIETHGLKRYLLIHTLNKSYPCPKSLKYVEAKLPNGFFRCHKSYILNKAFIDRIEFSTSNHVAHFKNGSSCLISKNYVEQISELL